MIDYLSTVSKNSIEDLRIFIDDKIDYREKILSMFDFLEFVLLGTNYQGCHFLNVSAEIPKDNLKVNAIIINQKNKLRQLIAEVLEPEDKISIADEIYVLFDGCFVVRLKHFQIVDSCLVTSCC